MSALFQPLPLRSLTLANRIVVSPMCQYSAVDGDANDWHEIHLGSLALGGAGLLCLEATGVTPEGRITPGCLGLWSDANEAALKRVVTALRAHSAIPLALQLGHAGRKGSSNVPWKGGQLIAADAPGGWQPMAPSAVPHLDTEAAPRAMTADDLASTLDAYVQTARRAARLGFDALEIHCAHGYLLHQFLSPIANKRTDAYGGSLENRMRFPLEVFDAVRAEFPADRPVGVRISGTDWMEHSGQPSWTIADSVVFAGALKARGCDWIDVSSGGISPQQKIPVGPGYQVPLADAVRRATGMVTFSVGMITTPAQAEAVIAEGRADCVALARAMLYNPRWAWHAAAELGATVVGPEQYWRCLPAGVGRVFGDVSVGQR